MRLGSANPARPDWYDRSPVAVVESYNTAGVAPHAQTTRWTYTVPAGKKTAVQAVFVRNRRDTAAAAVGTVDSRISYTPSGGSANILARSVVYNLALDAGAQADIGSTMVILAGDAISGITEDTSTGGTVTYNAAFQGMEFDA